MKELIRDVQTDKLLERSGPQSRKSRPLVVRACAPVIAAALFLPLAAQPAGATTVASEPLSVAATALPGLTAADSGAKQCGEPGTNWERATTSEAGFDNQKLQEAVNYATLTGSAAVRVYRFGCLVAEDALSPEGRALPTPSFSVAKSVTSMLMGRAWTQGLISPSDPVGSLFPEADYAHGKISVGNLATMTSGNDQTVTHDFNFAMPDRVRDGLTIPLVHEPGEYWNYWQTGMTMLAESVTRAAGEDIQDYAQAELFGPIGISRDRWSWIRDAEGHTAGYYGLSMTADDYGRIGELLRRDGVWKGQRLLSQEYTEYALTPSAAFPCYAAGILRSALPECNNGLGPYLGLPSDMWEFRGAGGQTVTAFPSQGVMTVRTGGDDATAVPTASATARQFHDMILGALADPVSTPHLPTRDDITHERYDGSMENPFFTLSAVVQPPLPAPGPHRARATIVAENVAVEASRLVTTISCPKVHFGPAPGCAGTLSTDATSDTQSYTLQPGAQTQLRLHLTPQASQTLTKTGELSITLRTANRDGTAEGTTATALRVAQR